MIMTAIKMDVSPMKRIAIGYKRGTSTPIRQVTIGDSLIEAWGGGWEAVELRKPNCSFERLELDFDYTSLNHWLSWAFSLIFLTNQYDNISYILID
jgi:hypothetical protein